MRQSFERVPGRYVVPSRFAITPSSSCVAGRFEQRLAVADAVRRHQPVVARFDELVEQPAALLVRQLDRVGAVDGEHVEQLEDGLPGRTHAAVLDELEPRPALVVEHDEFAVEHARSAFTDAARPANSG